MGLLLIVILFIAAAVALRNTLTVDFKVADLQTENMAPADLQRYRQEKRASRLTCEYGPRNPALRCPHCQQKGQSRTLRGAPATRAMLLGGVSLGATEVSRKEQGTPAYCGKCERTWDPSVTVATHPDFLTNGVTGLNFLFLFRSRN